MDDFDYVTRKNERLESTIADLRAQLKASRENAVALTEDIVNLQHRVRELEASIEARDKEEREGIWGRKKRGEESEDLQIARALTSDMENAAQLMGARYPGDEHDIEDGEE